MTFCYRIYGLNVLSTLEFPELDVADPVSVVDITIEFGLLPAALPTVEAQGPVWQFGSGQFLLAIPNVARYLINQGRQILIDAEPNTALGDIRLYLLGSVFGVLLHQRGFLALHASAIEVNGRVIAFAGHSGAGKSTLVAHLRQRGYRVLSDDLLVVDFDNSGNSIAHSSFARLKLWADALQHIEHAPELLVRDHSRLEKFHLQLDRHQPDIPLPLGAVFVLEANEVDDEIHIETLRGLDAVDNIVLNTYRLRFLKAMGFAQKHFAHCSRVASRASVFRIRRPKMIGQMDAVLDALEVAWSPLS
ncbi:MAG: HPr kinase [Proteobacteria bacterium]|nr:HPr kinase [Pseudomonadota bacterium]